MRTKHKMVTHTGGCAMGGNGKSGGLCSNGKSGGLGGNGDCCCIGRYIWKRA